MAIPGVIPSWVRSRGDLVKDTYGDDQDFSIYYDPEFDELVIKDEQGLGRNVRYGGDIVMENGEIISNSTDTSIIVKESGASPNALELKLNVSGLIGVFPSAAFYIDPDAVGDVTLFGLAPAGVNRSLIVAGRNTSDNGLTEVLITAGNGGVNDDIKIVAADGNFQFLTDAGMGAFFGTPATDPLAQVHILQSKTDAAEPVLYLDQKDVSEPMARLDCTAGINNGISAETTTGSTKNGSVKVNINGTDKWLWLYDSSGA